MASKPKRNIVIKKKTDSKPEKPVTTTPQNTESKVSKAELNNVQSEIEKQAQNIIGDVGGSKIVKPVWRIKFEAQVAPVPMFMLPEDIRRYLQSHWLSSDVFKKDKEWLEKHNVDMEMVEKLKKFLTERL